MSSVWQALAAPLDVSTGDIRRFAHDADINRRDFPMPLMWQRETRDGHDGSVVVGSIEQMTVDESDIRMSGRLFDDTGVRRLDETVRQFIALAGRDVLGLSVDLEPDMDIRAVSDGADRVLADEVDDDDVLEMLLTRATVMGATALPGPAFGQTSGAFQITPDTHDDEDDADADDDDVLTASAGEFAVIGSTRLPVADPDRAWDGDAAQRRMVEAGASVAGRGHLYRDSDADPDTQVAYKLPFADVIDDELTIVPRGVAAAAGGRGVDAADIPSEQKRRIKRRVCTLYSKIQRKHEQWPDCPFGDDTQGSLTAASAVQVREPVDGRLFADPGLDHPVPLAVEGQHVYGHLALFSTCHVRFPDVCVTAPHSAVQYAMFNRYAVDTDTGTVFAGRITGDGDHPSESMNLMDAMSVYDTLPVFAWVTAGVDDIGIWVSGVLSEDVTPRQLQTLARRKISGDWREHGGGLELIEALALHAGPAHLSEPGFPVRATVRDGVQRSLIACLGPEVLSSSPQHDSPPDPREFAREVVREVDSERARVGHQRDLAHMLIDDEKKRLSSLMMRE